MIVNAAYKFLFWSPNSPTVQSKRCPNRIHNNPGTLLEQSRRAVGIGVDVDEHEALSLYHSHTKKTTPATDFHSSHKAYPPSVSAPRIPAPGLVRGPLVRLEKSASAVIYDRFFTHLTVVPFNSPAARREEWSWALKKKISLNGTFGRAPQCMPST